MKKSALIALALLSAASAFAAVDKITINSIEDIKKCGEQNRWDTGVCFEAYQKFVDKNPAKALEAAKAGKTVFVHWAVFPTFDKVYARTKDVAICQDKDFQLSWANALGQPPRHDAYKLAEKYLKNQCAPYLVEVAMKELDSYAGSSAIENFCPLLKANGKAHKACEPQAAEDKPVSEKEVLPALEKSKIALERIKTYRGPEGVKVSIAQIKGEKDAYLIKFQGIKGPWDNKTLVHKARPLNNGEMDYWTEYGGKTWNSIAVRDCRGGYCQTTMFAPELGSSNGFSIHYSATESEKAVAQDLMATF
jgi:hypothetical protein